jgi:hypothetical protein
LTLAAPSLTLDLKLTGSGAGNGVGTGWVGAVGTGSWELTAAGPPGPPAQAARVVASKTAPAAPESLRIVVVGINIPMSDIFNTVGAPPE